MTTHNPQRGIGALALSLFLASCDTPAARDQALFREYRHSSTTGRQAEAFIGGLRYTGVHPERATIAAHEKQEAYTRYKRTVFDLVVADDVLDAYRTTLTTPSCTETRTDKETYDMISQNREINVLVWDVSERFQARGWTIDLPQGCAISLLPSKETP